MRHLARPRKHYSSGRKRTEIRQETKGHKRNIFVGYGKHSCCEGFGPTGGSDPEKKAGTAAASSRVPKEMAKDVAREAPAPFATLHDRH